LAPTKLGGPTSDIVQTEGIKSAIKCYPFFFGNMCWINTHFIVLGALSCFT